MTKPWAEGFAIIGDSIVAVGSEDEIDQWIGDKTRRIETSDGNLDRAWIYRLSYSFYGRRLCIGFGAAS